MNFETKKLSDVCDIVRGGSPRPIKKFITTSSDGFNWIKISDATSSKKYIFKTKQKIKKEGASRSRIVKEGDLILSNSMSFGRPYIMKTTGCVHDGWLILSNYQSKLDIEYFYHILSSSLVINQFESSATGSTVRNLNIQLVKNIEISFPPIVEQQRIVAKLDAAFAEIDKTISLTKQKKIEEKNIKLSILKSIFSINKSQKTIGKIATVIAGQSPEGKYYNKTAKGIPFYQGKKEFGDYELKKPNVWTTKTTKVSLKGDVLLSVRAPVGETNINNEKICIGRGLAAIRANKECNSEFIYYFLNSIKDKIVGNTGAVFNSINKKQIEDIIIPAPSSDEQTQIVNKIKSIFSLMNEINLLTKQKLDNLNILKSSILKQELRNKSA